MMDHDNAVELASGYAVHHATVAMEHLVRLLCLDPTHPGLREALAPFATVWAAMITAAAEMHGGLAYAEIPARDNGESGGEGRSTSSIQVKQASVRRV